MLRRTVQILSYALVIALAVACYFSVFDTKPHQSDDAPELPSDLIAELSDYCSTHNLRTDHIIIVDFSIHSSRNRFFVINTAKRSVIIRSKCAAGSGTNKFNHLSFSNRPGSNCSCIGHFAVIKEQPMPTRKVPSLVLNGLDSTNSNALKRGILIHPSKTVDAYTDSAQAVIPSDPTVSSGCFSISSAAMAELKNIFSQSAKPMLLYAFH